jgi:methionine-rich copper-binding protein CopC
LRTARPAAPEDLVRRLAAQATPLRRPQSRRFAMAGLATAIMLVGLAAIGGVGRAASELHHVVNVATGQTHTFGTHLAVQMDSQSAARAQYNPATTTSGNTTTATIPANTSSTVSTPSGSSVTLTSSTPLKASVTNALPSSVTSTATLASGKIDNKFVTVTLTDSSGNAIATLVTPMTVSISVTQTTSSSSSNTSLPSNYAVTFSTDGTSFEAIPECVGGQLGSGQTACYVLTTSSSDRSSAASGADSGPTIQILSVKAGIFGLVYKANITKSESGRTVPQAGSGKFGDPTRNHVGAPVLKQVGSKIAPKTSLQSTKVPFNFTVDEQAAVYISIYDAKGNPVWIRTTGTKIRGHAYSGKAVHTLHFAVLRPGQINTLLNVAPGTFKAGQTYKIRITAIDFDGHKVTEYTTFTG